MQADMAGRPMAMMAFKTIGYITMSQGITYAQVCHSDE
jgi:hypothetical protein